LAVNATSMTIAGFGFDPTTPGHNVVSFSPGGTGTVTAATNTQLTVSNLSGLSVGNLSASVTTNSQSSGAAVQAATVVPVITASTAALGADQTMMTIHGFGFDSATPGNNVVTFSPAGTTGTVTGATSTTLTVTSLTGLVAGNLNASVSVDGFSSGTAVQVATVTPVVTMSTASLAANATSMTIAGFGFD